MSGGWGSIVPTWFTRVLFGVVIVYQGFYYYGGNLFTTCAGAVLCLEGGIALYRKKAKNKIIKEDTLRVIDYLLPVVSGTILLIGCTWFGIYHQFFPWAVILIFAGVLISIVNFLFSHL